MSVVEEERCSLGGGAITERFSLAGWQTILTTIQSERLPSGPAHRQATQNCLYLSRLPNGIAFGVGVKVRPGMCVGGRRENGDVEYMVPRDAAVIRRDA